MATSRRVLVAWDTNVDLLASYTSGVYPVSITNTFLLFRMILPYPGQLLLPIFLLLFSGSTMQTSQTFPNLCLGAKTLIIFFLNVRLMSRINDTRYKDNDKSIWKLTHFQ